MGNSTRQITSFSIKKNARKRRKRDEREPTD